MPELPEVETVVRYLNSKIQNNTIHKIVFKYDGVVKNTSVSNFKDYLLNEKIIKITRKGKFIIFHITNNKC